MRPLTTLGLDGYSFRARWLPCVLIATPLVLAVARRGGAGRQVNRIGVLGELDPRLAPRDAATNLG